ncbi:MAG: hypothetical protein OD811_03565 [Alphaproteobacteria bacterium]
MPSLLEDMEGGLDSDALLELIQALRTRSHDAQIELTQRGIEARRLKLQGQHDKTIKQLKESDRKAAESKTASIVSQALTWIAFALAMILAVVTAIVSFGAGSAAIGAVALIGAAIAITVTILNETGVMGKLTDLIGEGIGDVLQMCGVSADEARKVGKIIAQVLIAVLIIAIEIALAIVSGGSSLGEAVGEITSVVAQKAAKVAVRCIQIGSAATQVVNAGSGASSIASGAYSAEAMNLTAEAMRDKGIMKKLESLITRDQKLIKQLIQLIEQGRQDTNSTLDMGHKTREKIVTGTTAMA